MLSADEFRRAAQRLNIAILDGGNNTNFRNEIARTGFVQNHHIAFGGVTRPAATARRSA